MASLIFIAIEQGRWRSLLVLWIFFLTLLTLARGFCGDSIKWSHTLKIEDVYGMWYGVGYAQHTPDMTNKPNEVGCVTLFIADATMESNNDWLDWSIKKKNYTDQNWRSYKSNPWSDTPMSGSWLDVRIKRKVKRDMYNERKIRVLWDEDGQTMEQIYLYTPVEAGLWVAEERTELEKEMMARGMEIWFPNQPPKHPQVVRILKATPQTLWLNHCSDKGDGGIFSLILRRSPSKMQRWEWYDVQRQFFNFELPNMHRYTAICAGCVDKSSLLFVLLCVTAWRFL